MSTATLTQQGFRPRGVPSRLGELTSKSTDSTTQFHVLPPTPRQGYSAGTIAVTSVLMGLVFGVALEKGQVYQPDIIKAQFLFIDNTMLKMFLSAMGTTALVVQLLRMKYATQTAPATTEYSFTFTRGVLAAFLGGTILGFGMQLSGSCPGTVWIQTGANTDGFVGVWLGGLTGAFAFSYLYDRLEASGLFRVGQGFLRRYPSLPDTGYTGFLLAAALAGVVLVADVLSPQRSLAAWTGNPLTMVSWHPAIAGIVVGLVQIPGALVVGELIGSSQTYVTLAGSSLSKFTGLKIPGYLKKYASGTQNFAQVFYMLGAVGGAALSWLLSHHFDFSSLISSSHNVTHHGVSSLESFLGGFCLVFGARVAGGCTSGHGLSGGGSLAIGSFIAVAGMFGGAIALAVVRMF